MRFWDASAIVPLLVREATSNEMLSMFQADPEQVVWWATVLECASAISRRESLGDIDSRAATVAAARLSTIGSAWREVEPSASLRTRALGLLQDHTLRAADALQLAAALVAGSGSPNSLEFVCLDQRLNDAATREGLKVVP